MKVIVLTPNYPRKDARMNGIFIHQQVKALISLGVECHVILTYQWFPPFGLHKFHTYWNSGYSRFSTLFEEFEGVKIHRVPVFVKMPERFFPENPIEREANTLASYITKSKELKDVDCIYGSFLTDSAYTAVLLKELVGKKVITIARGDDVHAWPQENPNLIPIIQKVVKNSDIVLANSRRLANDTLGWLDSSITKPIGVVYNGVDLNKFSPPSILEKEKLKSYFFSSATKNVLLCVATPVEIKGWLMLLDSISEIQDIFQNWELVIVAVNRTNPDALDLWAESKTRGIEGKVRILGQLEHQALAQLYKAADAFVLPSFNEGLANVVLEAAASNLPLLITDVGGHLEVFEKSKSTVIVPPCDKEALKTGLKTLLTQVVALSSDTRKIVSQNVGDYLHNAKKLKEYFEKQ